MKDRVVSTADILATGATVGVCVREGGPVSLRCIGSIHRGAISGASSQAIGTLRRPRACRPGAAPRVTNARIRAEQAPEHHARRLPRILLRLALPVPEADAGPWSRQR